MSFAYPALLLLLAIPPLLLWLRIWRRRKLEPSVAFSNLGLASVPTGWRVRGSRVLPWLRLLALLLLVVALARPRKGESEVEVTSEGIDIVIALDISGSMKAEDFQPNNRLFVAKREAKRFIEGRTSDRIGLVVFASNSYTQCPLTTDYHVLEGLIDDVKFGDIQDGTAIGMAIANGVNRLKDIPGKSRILILLTDGQNNAGAVDPVTAAELAKSVGVRIYTVGVGAEQEAPYPVDDPMLGRHYVYLPAQIDEETLQKVADLTGGEYFRATDAEALEQIYERIDQLEKTKV
ncbi:MAG: VWA domain-containing protein [Candidatus Eisenbacteria bacterium]